MDTFQLQQCFGRDLGSCVADINCEWDPYYNACANRTYDAIYGWGPRWNNWGWGRDYRRGWGHRGVWRRHRV